MIRERVKRSVIWTMTDMDFIELVKNSVSVGEICEKLKIRHNGSIFVNIKSRIEKLNINIDHFKDRRSKTYNFNHVSQSEFISRLESNNHMDFGFIKKKIIEFGLVEYKCRECNLTSEWNNKPLVLQLDHIDGDYLNNKIDNLRFLCPNCHSQTETFSMGKRKRSANICQDCGSSTSGYGVRCHKCACKHREQKKREQKNAW